LWRSRESDTIVGNFEHHEIDPPCSGCVYLVAIWRRNEDKADNLFQKCQVLESSVPVTDVD